MKLKIPPALQVVLFGFLMWFIKKITQQQHFDFQYQNQASWLIFFIGIILGLFAVYSFKKAKTTVDPLNPEKASQLVVQGLYKYSRNPMYVAMLFVLIAFCLRLGNLYNLVVVVIYIWFITEFQIKPEEKTLTKLFGQDYNKYISKVRRWL